MNKLALVLALVAFTSPVLAAGGTITFNGELIDQTCAISLNGSGSPDGTVALAPVLSGYVQHASGDIDRTEFTVTLTNCTHQKAVVFFESGPTVTSEHRLKNTAVHTEENPKANNVELAIYRKYGYKHILIGDDTQHDEDHEWSTISDNPTLSYYVSYFPILSDIFTPGIVTPGKVESQVTYIVKYR